MATPNFFFACLIILILPQFLSSTSGHMDSYIIHMDPASMPRVFSGHHQWYTATVASTTTKEVDTTRSNSYNDASVIYSYSTAIHGFSAKLSKSQLQDIKLVPGYINSYKDASVRVDTTRSTRFLGLSLESGAWPAAHYGEDMIIGLVDSGIWPESPSFNDHGMTRVPSRWKGRCETGTNFNISSCNRKLIGARYFNRGLLAMLPNITIAMNSTRDTHGHGTHTSSTAAGSFVHGASYFGYAKGTARGAAPSSRLAMYKALWDQGTFLSDILAAIDQAISDGVDVISLSLGTSGVPLYEDPVAIAAFSAMEKGIFVSTSAGNDGPHLGTLHNGVPWVLTVGAGTMDRALGGTVTLGNGLVVAGSGLYPPGISFSSRDSNPIILDECDYPEKLRKIIAGAIIVCLEENNFLMEQYFNVQAANISGGVAVFITNDTTDIGLYLQSSFPALILSPQQGQVLVDYVKGTSKNNSSIPKGTVRFGETRVGLKPAPRVAGYSSRGPSTTCPFVLKPDLIAPGDMIIAAWPGDVPVRTLDGSGQLFSNFNLLSGTSMACPHAAGIAALLKAVHPDWSPAALRSAMVTTSYHRDNTLTNPIADLGNGNRPATPLDMGAGHVHPNQALDPGLVYDLSRQDYINFLCALSFTMKQMQAITRSSSSSIDCTNRSIDLNYPSFIVLVNTTNGSATGSDRAFRRTLTNVGSQGIYEVKLVLAKGLKVWVEPKKLIFREKYDKQTFRVRIRVDARTIKDATTLHGSLTWTDGKHQVRTPIVATEFSPFTYVSDGDNEASAFSPLPPTRSIGYLLVVTVILWGLF